VLVANCGIGGTGRRLIAGETQAVEAAKGFWLKAVHLIRAVIFTIMALVYV
jgi:hypothetical protein